MARPPPETRRANVKFCAIRSYLSTAAKHGLGKLQALALAATGTAWMPKAA
jgi:hypothetical protein